jgi:hypothetical protein
VQERALFFCHTLMFWPVECPLYCCI